jgi:hypothetical protein
MSVCVPSCKLFFSISAEIETSFNFRRRPCPDRDLLAGSIPAITLDAAAGDAHRCAGPRIYRAVLATNPKRFRAALPSGATLSKYSAVHTNWKDDLWPGQPRSLSRSASASRSMATCRPSSDPAHRIAYPNQINSKAPPWRGFCLKPSKLRPDAQLTWGLWHGASRTAYQQKRERVAVGLL